MRDRLVNPLLAPAPEDVAFAAAVTRDMLRLRRDTPLLRLRTAEEIVARTRFHLTGPSAPPGVIVMELRDDLGGVTNLDPSVARLLLVFNASPTPLEVSLPALNGLDWEIHPVLVEGADARAREASLAAGALMVPGLTTAVFVAPGVGQR
jgi:hypothetical protein